MIESINAKAIKEAERLTQGGSMLEFSAALAGFRAGYDHGAERPGDRHLWVRANERLPEIGMRVLTCFDGYLYQVERIAKDWNPAEWVKIVDTWMEIPPFLHR